MYFCLRHNRFACHLVSTSSSKPKTSSLSERLLPFRMESSAAGRRVRVYWRRFLVWLMGLLALLWLLVAMGIWLYVKYERAYTTVKYSQVLQLPWRWDEFQRSKGEFWISQGMELAKQGQWRDAFDFLRAGLVDVPEDEAARLMLVRIYLMAGRDDSARELLADGLAHSPELFSYMRSVMGFLFSQQADGVVVDLTSAVIRREAPDSELTKLARSAQAIAYFNRDQFSEAEATLRGGGLQNNVQSRLLLARIAWEQGYRETALIQLRELLRVYPQDDEVYRNLVTYLREAGLDGEVRSLCVGRQVKYPDRPDAFLDFIEVCHDAGDTQRRDAGEEEFFRRFAEDASALERLGEYAARFGRVALADRLLARCQLLGREVERVAISSVSARLEARDYGSALMKLDELSSGPLEWGESLKAVLLGFRTVALFGLGKALEAEPELGRLLESRVLTAQSANSFAFRLQKLGQPDAALKLLHRAVEIDPLYQPALVSLLRAELPARDLAELRPFVERLPTLRKPPADLLVQLRATFESDRYLYLPRRAELVAKLAPRGGK